MTDNQIENDTNDENRQEAIEAARQENVKYARKPKKRNSHRRKVILVRPAYQNRVGFFSGIMAVIGVLIGVASLVLLPLLVGAFSKQRTYIPTKMLDSLMLSFPWMILGIGMIFAFAVLAGIYYSHRVAGPLNKIERILKRRLTGEAVGMIRLRPQDQLHDLSQLLNDVIQSDVQIEASGNKTVEALESVLGTVDIIGSTVEITTEQFMLLAQCKQQLEDALQRPHRTAKKMAAEQATDDAGLNEDDTAQGVV